MKWTSLKSLRLYPFFLFWFILRFVESQIISLEMKLAYLEDFVQQLQEVVLEQESTIERLVAENQHIKRKIADMAGQLEGDIPNRRPPHY